MNVYTPEGTRIGTAKNKEYISSEAGLERALEKQVILEAPVILCDRKFDLHVSLCPSIYGIIRRDEVELTRNGEETKDIAILTRVGKAVCFKVTGFGTDECGKRFALLSRRAAQLECSLNYVSGLIPGDIISAKVTHTEHFGAFLDIGCGIISLLPIDSISVSRIRHPSERLSVGESVLAVIKSTDSEGRIFVSQRELLGTWEENAAAFSEGQTVKGTVRGIEDYGIFVELSPNLAGLAEFKEGVKEGETAAVYIKSIIPEKMKIKLIIIDSGEPEDSKVPLRYSPSVTPDGHIDSWIYSPERCLKRIESIFDQR
jgi:small subunit ribosomal protein S1